MIEELTGKVVTIFCGNFIYTGKLVSVVGGFAKLQDPSIVFETGSFEDVEWANAQRLPDEHFYINVAKCESFGVVK